MQVINFVGLTEKISEEMLRKKFPQPEYRVSPRVYRSDENRPPGSARAGLLFVLRGKCSCNFGRGDENLAVLEAGQCVEFPEGRYQIEPFEDQDVEIAFVWNVKKLFKEIFPNNPDH